MGILSIGAPLSWEETKKWTNLVTRKGIEQFIELHEKFKDKKRDWLKWGDEIEYIIVRFDHENKRAQLSLRSNDILHQLQGLHQLHPESKCRWMPEYGAFMLEGIPANPYGESISQLKMVEANMKLRRLEVQQFLHPDEVLMTVGNFPRLGCPRFTYPEHIPNPESSSTSQFFPDEAIFQDHPKFCAVQRNLRSRKGSKVDIQVPIFIDKNTPRPFIEEDVMDQKPDMIYMDAVGFGAGCCCLQITIQASCLDEAKTLYDNLAPICPIMLALTAATPFYRGYISDVDCRWNIISAALDCRRSEEMKFIPKSRYDSIDSYLSEENSEFNDIPLFYHEKHYESLSKAGVDEGLSKHIAHLFIRDPLLLFSDKVTQEYDIECFHFESIQTTNWQTLRFKPPPIGSSIGWRIEFRPCEVQLTDFENAAFSCFLVLLTRIILSFKLHFMIPISKVDENMKSGQKRDAILTEKFWFRNNTFKQQEKTYSLMTANEILNGNQTFPGLIPLVHQYLNSMEVDADTHCTLTQYLSLISRRAEGNLMTPAKWLRTFVSKHPSYMQDSVITEEINYDLLKEISLLK